MEAKQRKTAFDDLSKYCILSDKNDTIEVTEWTNGEGYDINLSCKHWHRQFSITHGELEAINYLTKVIEYSE